MNNSSGVVIFIKIIRWIARITGALLTLGALLYLEEYFGDYFSGNDVFYPDTLERILFPYVSVIGFILAWKWEGLGGIITIGGFLGSTIIDPHVTWQEIQGGIMYIVPGILFLLCWFLTKRSEKAL
jgi:hypothetical protein